MSSLHIRFGRPESLPLDVLLSLIPSLSRQALDRLVDRAIDHMDVIDGDADLEEDDPAGGNVEDEGEPAGAEDCGHVADYGVDQRLAANGSLGFNVDGDEQ